MHFHLLRKCGSSSSLGSRMQAVSWTPGGGRCSRLPLFPRAPQSQSGRWPDREPDAWNRRPLAWPTLLFIFKLGEGACYNLLPI